MEFELLVEAARREREARSRRSSLLALYEAENSGRALVSALRKRPAARPLPAGRATRPEGLR